MLNSHKGKLTHSSTGHIQHIIFQIELRPILRFFLKSINLKYSTMSPNNHSTDVRTLDVDLLKASICAVRA